MTKDFASYANADQFITLGRENVEALVKSSTIAAKGVEELIKSVQANATKTYEQNVAAFQRLSSVKSPTEFFEIYSGLARESVESAVAESRKLAESTQALLTASLEPITSRVKSQIKL